MLGAYGSELSIRLLSNLILTRLLFPEAFGVIAAASSLVFGLTLVTDFGTHVIIIQSARGDQVAFLRSAWVFQFCRGFVSWIVLAALCALISVPAIRALLPPASVFADHSFPLIAASMGFIIVLDGARSMSIPLNQRLLNYRPIVVANLTARALSLPIMIFWAWNAPSVWALVGGALATSLFDLILSHTFIPGPWMSLRWEKDHFQEIVRFGRWIAVSSFGTFISQQFDVILLGVLMPSSSLGLYSIAKLFVSTGEGLFDRFNSSLALPIFGEVIRKDPSNLRDRYYRFRLPIEIAAGVFSGGLFAIGNFMINFLYDSRYTQAGSMLQILALGTAVYPSLIIRNAFTAAGDAHISAFVSILQAASLVVCVSVGFFVYGPLGAIGGVASHRVIPSMVLLVLARQRNWIGILRELRIVPAFIVGVLVGHGLVLVANALGLANVHQLLRFHT